MGAWVDLDSCQESSGEVGGRGVGINYFYGRNGVGCVRDDVRIFVFRRTTDLCCPLIRKWESRESITSWCVLCVSWHSHWCCSRTRHFVSFLQGGSEKKRNVPPHYYFFYWTISPIRRHPSCQLGETPWKWIHKIQIIWIALEFLTVCSLNETMLK